jgi:hypothetical protein
LSGQGYFKGKPGNRKVRAYEKVLLGKNSNYISIRNIKERGVL